MKNISFVLWMVLFPVATQLADYLAFLTRGSVVKQWSESTELGSSLIYLVAWIVVGVLLYQQKHDVSEIKTTSSEQETQK